MLAVSGPLRAPGPASTRLWGDVDVLTRATRSAAGEILEEQVYREPFGCFGEDEFAVIGHASECERSATRR